MQRRIIILTVVAATIGSGLAWRWAIALLTRYNKTWVGSPPTTQR